MSGNVFVVGFIVAGKLEDNWAKRAYWYKFDFNPGRFGFFYDSNHFYFKKTFGFWIQCLALLYDLYLKVRSTASTLNF
jgi:hypothetical protein